VLKSHRQVFCILSVIFDVVLVSAAWLTCYVVRFRLGLLPIKEPVPPGVAQFAALLPLVVCCDLVFIVLHGLYRREGSRSLLTEKRKLAEAGILGWLALLAALYYYRSVPYSRVMLFLFFVANPLALLASRALLRATLRGLNRSGWAAEHAAILGTGRLAATVLQKLQGNPALGIQVDYFIEDDNLPAGHDIAGVPVLDSLRNLASCMSAHPVDTVFVALRAEHMNGLERILGTLQDSPAEVVVVPEFTNVVTQKALPFDIPDLPMIRLRGMPMTGLNALAKRFLDIVGALLLLLILSVPTLILVALVKLTSPGPVLYRQKRMGLGGRPFIMLKFRSMDVDAESETGPIWGGTDDPRCTPVGRLMRRTGLDELPQLLNVLRGEMSLVGPRPERPHFVERFASELPAYMLRHNVKAGLTGWAQVKGLRGNTSLEKRLQYDLYYISNWSLGFDLFILFLTPFSRFLH